MARTLGAPRLAARADAAADVGSGNRWKHQVADRGAEVDRVTGWSFMITATEMSRSG